MIECGLFKGGDPSLNHSVTYSFLKEKSKPGSYRYTMCIYNSYFIYCSVNIFKLNVLHSQAAGSLVIEACVISPAGFLLTRLHCFRSRCFVHTPCISPHSATGWLPLRPDADPNGGSLTRAPDCSPGYSPASPVAR